jgi:hypothetical protein
VLKSLLWHFGLLPSTVGIRALRAFRQIEYQRSCLKLAEKLDLALARLLRQPAIRSRNEGKIGQSPVIVPDSVGGGSSEA